MTLFSANDFANFVCSQLKKFIRPIKDNDIITEQRPNLMFCVTCNPAESLNSILIFLGKKEKLSEESQTK